MSILSFFFRRLITRPQDTQTLHQTTAIGPVPSSQHSALCLILLSRQATCIVGETVIGSAAVSSWHAVLEGAERCKNSKLMDKISHAHGQDRGLCSVRLLHVRSQERSQAMRLCPSPARSFSSSFLASWAPPSGAEALRLTNPDCSRPSFPFSPTGVYSFQQQALRSNVQEGNVIMKTIVRVHSSIAGAGICRLGMQLKVFLEAVETHLTKQCFPPLLLHPERPLQAPCTAWWLALLAGQSVCRSSQAPSPPALPGWDQAPTGRHQHPAPRGGACKGHG